MTATTTDAATEITAPTRFWNRSRRLGVALVVLGIAAAAVCGTLAPSGNARFTISQNESGAAISINGQFGAILFGVVTIAAGVALLAGASGRWQTVLLGVGIVAFVLSFLCWQVAGKFLPLVDTASGTLQLALPLILGALAGVIGERSGVVNVAIG